MSNPKSKQDFQTTDEPWSYLAIIDPETNVTTGKYLEGWNHGEHVEQVKEHYPYCFVYFVHNEAAHYKYLDSQGLEGIKEFPDV